MVRDKESGEGKGNKRQRPDKRRAFTRGEKPPRPDNDKTLPEEGQHEDSEIWKLAGC